MKQEIKSLCLSGGGARGIVYCGFLKRLYELMSDKESEIKVNINRVCGVSVGSIFGLLFVLGYTWEEILDEIVEKNLSQLKNFRFTNFLTRYGLDSGRHIVSWLETLILKKGLKKDVTFSELFVDKQIHFQVLATNLNKYKWGIFDHIATPDTIVTRAIRLSIGIPFIFTAETYKGDVYVDGALINNYPIDIFADDLEHVLGVKIVSFGELEEHIVDNNITELDNYVYNVFSCLLVGKERQTTLSKKFQDHTIYIHSDTINHTINFSLTKEEKLKLVEIGYSATDMYFNKCVNSVKVKNGI